MNYVLTRSLCLVSLLVCQMSVWAANDRLLVWEVEGGSASMVLFGSVHMAYPETYPIRSELEEAYASADHLVVEVDIGGQRNAALQALMLQRGSLPQGESLQQYLSSDTWQLLQAHLADLSLPVAMLNRMHPGLVGATLTALRISELGMQADLGLDRHFLDRREERTVVELESMEQQLDLLLGFPDADALMSHTLSQLDSIEKYLTPVYNAWLRGDDAMLAQLLLEDDRHSNPQFEEIYVRLFDERNLAMSRKLELMLRQHNAYFVVVGAGHLVGEQGIVKLLKDKGYTLKRR